MIKKLAVAWSKKLTINAAKDLMNRNDGESCAELHERFHRELRSIATEEEMLFIFQKDDKQVLAREVKIYRSVS